MIIGVVVGTLLVIMLSGFIVISMLLYKNSQVRHRRRIEEMSHEYTQEILKARLEIREQTLNFVSQEIHDNLGQILSLVKLNLNLLSRDPASNQEKLTTTKELVTRAISDLRNISHNLSTLHVYNDSLVNLVKKQLVLVDATGAYKTTLELSGDEPALNNELHLILFRLIQEIINNILKHAEATTIEVKLVFTENLLDLSIRDNGKGFDTDALIQEGKPDASGINSMNHRVKLLNGTLDLISVAQQGTTVSIQVPLKHNTYE